VRLRQAVQDGMQVAVLVPTTLLVQQHFSTFSDRYAPFPVKVRALSRSRPARPRKPSASWPTGTSTWSSVRTAAVAETRFKRLGLVIIDEEQRFGWSTRST